jgi:hypothetical protein
VMTNKPSPHVAISTVGGVIGALFCSSESGNQRPESLDVNPGRSHMTTVVCERRRCEIRVICIAM